MKPNCPYCECGKHTARNRAYACGTMYNGRGIEYRSQTCELGEQRLHAQRAAESLAKAAQASEDAMRIERDAALAEAERDRNFSINFHLRLAEAMSAYRTNLMREIAIAASRVTTETFNEEGPKLLALQMQLAASSSSGDFTGGVTEAVGMLTQASDTCVCNELDARDLLAREVS